MKQSELKSLIQRFATHEGLSQFKGKSGMLWRRRRLTAITIFEERFGPVPELLKSRKLKRLTSYYVLRGEYIWPSAAQQGAPGDGPRPAGSARA
jgi:hypothetical protein